MSAFGGFLTKGAEAGYGARCGGYGCDGRGNVLQSCVMTRLLRYVLLFVLYLLMGLRRVLTEAIREIRHLLKGGT